MYPYINLFGEKLYMTGIGIVLSFITFLIVSIYLTKRYHQNFWKFFYWTPILIVLCYFLWSYVQFMFEDGLFPTTMTSFFHLLSPYGYRFHFVGLVLWIGLSLWIFLRKIKRIENKKIWWDILFYSFALSLVPLGIFLLMWDNFIGLSTTSFLGIKSLHSESQRNKFNLVYPIGLFLSLVSLLAVVFVRAIRRKRFGFGMLGFSILSILVGIVLMFQHYPRHGVISLGHVMFDVKQYAAILAAVWSYLVYRKRRSHSNP